MPTGFDSAGTGRQIGGTFRQNSGRRLPSGPVAVQKSWGALIPDPVELSGLTEIRVHGVGGTRPQELLGDLAPTRVAGDRIAGFYRTSDARGRHREAYSWGGLTSHSPLRTLWLILFSSMLANMAGWTVRPHDTSTEPAALREPMTWRFRWCARLAALSLTISTAVMVTMFSLDTFAYQCLAQPRCRSPLWFSSVLDFFAPYDRPGSRLAFGVIIPVAVAALFYILASVSRSSYEDVEPPVPGRDRPVSGGLCAAAQADGLSSPKFWSGRRWHQHLSDLHLAAGIAVVAGMLGWCTSELSAAMKLPPTPALFTAWVAVLASALVIGTVLFMLSWDVAHEAAARLLLIFSIAALLLAVLAAITLPLQLMPNAGATAAQTAGVLPGIRVAVNCGWGLILAGLLVLVLQQTGAWIARWFSAWTAARPVPPGRRWFAWWKRAWETARHVRTLGGPERKEFGRRVKATARGGVQVFPWAAPVVFNALALIVGNAVLLSYMVLAAQVLGRAQYGFEPERPKPLGSVDDPAVLWVPPAVASIASILTLGLLAMFILFTATVWTWLLWSTRWL